MSGPDPGDEEHEGRPLLMERFRRMGSVLGVVVAAMMVIIMVPGGFRVIAGIIALVAILWFAGRRPDRDREFGSKD